MANKKLSSTQAYNEAIKPFIDHKNAYQEYKGTPTKGDIPRTESQDDDGQDVGSGGRGGGGY